MNKIITHTFCEPFIERLADDIEENFVKPGADLSRVAIVFGGKRPALFLKRELARRIGQDFYPPTFFTIDEFVRATLKKHGPFQQASDLDHCYLIFQLTKEVAPHLLKGRDTFARFLPWSREILKFIDHLDLEHIDNAALRNVQANAEIGYDVPEEINRLLESMAVLRDAYHAKVSDEGAYSRGYCYWQAAKVVSQVNFDEFDQILFCNFFYFSRSEEMIVRHLYDQNKATLIFQGDERKWPVLKRISRRFNFSISEGNKFKVPDFNLKLYSGFDGHAQIGMVREILKKIPNPSDAVIVLPNPDHIVPLLSEVAPLGKEFNISMGYPLKRSSLYSLFQFVFKAQLSKKGQRYYARDYLRILQHPLVKNLRLANDSAVTRILIHKIEELLTGKEESSISGSLFIDLQEIASLDDVYRLTQEMLKRLGIEMSKNSLHDVLNRLHQMVLVNWESIHHFQDFVEVLGVFLDDVLEKSALRNFPLNVNIAAKMHTIKDTFARLSFKTEVLPKEEIFRIFESQVEGEIVAFQGSPLKGLQILGLFETRSLNFEHVIVLDTNEGALPRLNIYEPLIPREVMISLNLDRLELEEEIQRYQFMRLISSAKQVHLVYQQSKDKERSRFIEELLWEEQKKKKDAAPIEVQQASFAVKVAPQKKTAQKTPAMVNFLKRMTYSASSINTYLRNPYEFYCSYVLGLRPEEDLLDEPDARQVGTFIHAFLEEAFKPFLGKPPVMDTDFRGKFSKMFHQKFEDTFAKSMKSDAFLLKSVIEERLKRFLDNEEFQQERQVEELLYLEHRFNETIPLPCGDVRFGYVVDRIDKMKNGTIMIVDYKTGAVDQMPRLGGSVETMSLSRESIYENVKSFQLPLYLHYLEKNFAGQNVNAALYNLRTCEFKKFIDAKSRARLPQLTATFLQALDFIVSEIWNPEVDFEDVEP